MVLDIGVAIRGYTEFELDGIPSGVTGRMRSSQERFIKAQGILSYFALGSIRKPLINERYISLFQSEREPSASREFDCSGGLVASAD